MLKKEEIRISRGISYLLRHNPGDLQMDSNGWVRVKDLLYKLDINMQILTHIVENNDKKRFVYNDDKTKIRANQGHSIDVDVELKEAKPPIVLYHGTSRKASKIILKEGLSKMKRNHVHLSESVKTAYSVGYRHSDNPAVIVVDCEKMVEDDIKFYLSENNVWLTDNILPKYLDIWV